MSEYTPYTPYTPQSWEEGSAITREKLDKVEQGIFGAFRNRGILDNNKNLNDVLETGFYFLPGTDATPSYNYENLPEGISKKNYKLFEVFFSYKKYNYLAINGSKIRRSIYKIDYKKSS